MIKLFTYRVQKGFLTNTEFEMYFSMKVIVRVYSYSDEEDNLKRLCSKASATNPSGKHCGVSGFCVYGYG